jgi:hypothetical protein
MEFALRPPDHHADIARLDLAWRWRAVMSRGNDEKDATKMARHLRHKARSTVNSVCNVAALAAEYPEKDGKGGFTNLVS